MPASFNVHLLPSLATEQELFGKTVAVIDVLRATTTIVYALAAGAVKFVPCESVEEARQRAASEPGGCVLGGERGGRKIEGFDLGNSPAEFTPQSVGGKTVVFTTTNGTRALLHCRRARRVLVAAFANLSAVCDELSRATGAEILCAGTEGQITREDVLLAGALADDAHRRGAALNDQADVAADAWRAAAADFASGAPLAAVLRKSRGGRNLIEIGSERDIDIAAEIDRFELVPELDLQQWEIRAGNRA